jgi:hypothetical protein
MCRSEAWGRITQLIKMIDSKKKLNPYAQIGFRLLFLKKFANFGGILGESRSFTKKVNIHWQKRLMSDQELRFFRGYLECLWVINSF